MAPNFKNLLSVPLDDVEKPKPYPAGTWMGIIEKWEMGESSEKKTPFIRFFVTIQTPGDDIDPSQLEDVDLSKPRQMRADYYLTTDAMWRLKELMQSCGVETSGRTIAEALPDMQRAEVQCVVSQTPSSRNPEEFFNNIDRMSGTAALGT